MMMNGINDEIYDSKMDEYRAMIPVDQPVVHIIYNIIRLNCISPVALRRTT